jgi:hypothetical protein
LSLIKFLGIFILTSSVSYLRGVRFDTSELEDDGVLVLQQVPQRKNRRLLVVGLADAPWLSISECTQQGQVGWIRRTRSSSIRRNVV